MEESKVIYERDIYNSYLKMKAIENESFEEKILLRKKIEGLLNVEKCFINGIGEYWYNISGRQALDNYCSVGVIGKDLFVKLILRLCEQLELLEWNLMDTSCLIIHPEMIFISNRGEDISFLLYPKKQGDIFLDIQKLMEYILTKLDHADKEVVYMAYQLYEVMLQGQYSISDLRAVIMEKRIEAPVEQKEERTLCAEEGVEQENEKLSKLYVQAKEIFEKIVKGGFKEKKTKRKKAPEIVYPDEREEGISITVHPTVCLSMLKEEAQGVLLYEGKEGYQDFEIGKLMCVIGKNHSAKLQIKKDTISQFHAKIEYCEGTYYIEDMNSTNGTYLNEEMLNYKESKSLHPGDVIRFADVKYRFM